MYIDIHTHSYMHFYLSKTGNVILSALSLTLSFRSRLLKKSSIGFFVSSFISRTLIVRSFYLALHSNTLIHTHKNIYISLMYRCFVYETMCVYIMNSFFDQLVKWNGKLSFVVLSFDFLTLDGVNQYYELIAFWKTSEGVRCSVLLPLLPLPFVSLHSHYLSDLSIPFFRNRRGK